MSQDSPLVSTQWLAERLNDPGVRVVEAAFKNDDAGYREGHIPGAAWWYWKEWCWHETDREFPTPAQMAPRLGRIGVTPGTTLEEDLERVWAASAGVYRGAADLVHRTDQGRTFEAEVEALARLLGG